VLSAITGDLRKIFVIDTDDPCQRHFDYTEFDYVFLSQKLINPPREYPSNTIALNPHFPFKSLKLFFLICKNKNFIRYPKLVFKIVISNLRLKRFNHVINASRLNTENFIFYYRSLWKKEHNTNILGAVFLDTCRKIGFTVIGGLYRGDGYTMDNEMVMKYLVKKKLSNREYIRNLKRSKYVFNSPACNGALSWRFAEYLFANKTIITTKILVETPTNFNTIVVNGESIAVFTKQLTTTISQNLTIDNTEKVQKFLFPKAQGNYILSCILNSERLI